MNVIKTSSNSYKINFKLICSGKFISEYVLKLKEQETISIKVNNVLNIDTRNFIFVGMGRKLNVIQLNIVLNNSRKDLNFA